MIFVNKKAFTLIEILVVVFIMFIISEIVSAFIIGGLKSVKFNEEQEMATQQARDSMDEMTKIIRAANNSDNGNYILTSNIGPQQIEFYSDPDFDYHMEKVKYYLEGTQLKRSVIEPGELNSYNGTATITIVADYVNNISEPIFYYYDNDINETDIVNNIRSIRVYLKINVTPSRAPADYILESNVQIRNLKYK